MGWWEPVRAYCERGDAGFWAEPLNAVSNAAFLAACLLLLARAGRRPRNAASLALAALIGVIGIGSFLFHTLAVRWAELADVLPIAIFIHAYFFLALHRLLGLGAGRSALATLAFAAAGLGFEPGLSALAGRGLAAATNGSLAYLPALLALLGVGAALRASARPARVQAGSAMLGLSGLFLASLAARTLDAPLCGAIPIGIHWLWHVMNAALLAGLVTLLAQAGREPPG
ncbi:conserved hypothetical protein [Methylobacterium sp. 4-46]|uniref:ceramidase domain-containing protein n=1 Tax=unclassified Methylobacterium TaxID=2615210 RepID=UPI000152DCBE|nr:MULTISPECIES: ceramidase domain-containing protein [Methylobacterium]ACA17138.1 conserved hypothetical protein [Methylobacterium sp. 4-46]WFT82822.1 ceramidase domain-containing protein [Methylobacterium nodulans]